MTPGQTVYYGPDRIPATLCRLTPKGWAVIKIDRRVWWVRPKTLRERKHWGQFFKQARSK